MADVVTLPARSTRFVEQNRLYSQADPPPLSWSIAASVVSERNLSNTTPLKLAQAATAGLAGDW